MITSVYNLSVNKTWKVKSTQNIETHRDFDSASTFVSGANTKTTKSSAKNKGMHVSQTI